MLGSVIPSPSRVAFAIYLPILAGFALWSLVVGGVDSMTWLGGLSVGLLIWTLVEYFVHRFLFHWVPSSPRLREMQLHLLHHEEPGDPAGALSTDTT